MKEAMNLKETGMGKYICHHVRLLTQAVVPFGLVDFISFMLVDMYVCVTCAMCIHENSGTHTEEEPMAFYLFSS